VFERFRQYKALVEKQSGHYIKILRTNRGGEYISSDFLHFCRERGIHEQFTTRYTSHQNGVMEAKNKTIMEMERSMLKAKHFPNDYWVEVVACAIYIINRFPTKSVKNIIPEEAWSGRKHNVTHMRLFGFVVYAHVLDDLRKKLERKGEKCIFFGYSDESKAYKLYNLSTKKFIINRDVQFIEEEAWDGILENTVNVKTCMPDEDKEEFPTTSNSSTVTPRTPTESQQIIQHVTPQKNNRTMLRSEASASPCTPQTFATPYTLNSTPSPSFATIRGQKFINLSEIYEQNEVDCNVGLNSLFSLFFHVDYPIHFEDAVKEEKWVAAIDEEIGKIENNDHMGISEPSARKISHWSEVGL